MSHRRKCGTNLRVANDNNHGFAVAGCFAACQRRENLEKGKICACLVLRMLVFICDVYLYTV